MRAVGLPAIAASESPFPVPFVLKPAPHRAFHILLAEVLGPGDDEAAFVSSL